MDGADSLDGCVMGFPSCGGDHPCPLHNAWAAVKVQVATSMTESTIRDLQLMDLRNLKEAKGRLSEGKP
jgi:hypothetical protein